MDGPRGGIAVEHRSTPRFRRTALICVCEVIVGAWGSMASCAAMDAVVRLGWIGVGTVLAIGCKPSTVEPPPAGETVMDAAISEQVHAVMDEAVDPCTDFYRYACGQWLDENPLPGDQPRYGRFHALREHNKLALREILDEAVAEGAAEGPRGQLARFYGSCMDEAANETAGLAALQPVLEQIGAAKKKGAVMEAIATLHALGADVLFELDVDAGHDDPHTNIAHLGPGGLGMPDRDYYLEASPEADALREAYVQHVAVMLEAAGTKDAAGMAAKILALETKLAEARPARAEMRDPERRRNVVEVGALGAMAPKLDWAAYLQAVGQPTLERLNVAPSTYFEQLGAIVSGTKRPVLTAYFQWHLLHALGDHLPGALGQAHFEFFDKRMQGQAERTPSWRRCVEATDTALGEVLGPEYTERHFSSSSKAVSEEMIAQIEEAFAAALPELEWMDEATRARALEKMHAIDNKIGYPDRWRDYSGLEVGEAHVANVLASRRFERAHDLGKIGQPVDEGEWHMTTPTVNAYYNPSGNEMVFPAGILQPPFFDGERPMAMNFGGIGMVMGHELTHGFDDTGRKFDGDGRLTEWWGAEAVSRFEERAVCVEQLYDGYEIQPGVTLNGKLTLGENIADLGGVRQAHGAYQAWAAANGGDAAPVVEGLTNEQLLFVSIGQIWCTHATPEAERALAKTDTHSHSRYRVNGPLSNFPAFWEAFSCEEGTPMHPANVCEVW